MFEKFKDSLTRLKIILGEIEKTKIVERLGIQKNRKNKKRRAEKVRNKKNNKLKSLDKQLRLRTTRNRFWKRSKSIEEEKESRQITRQKINYIERLETEIKEMEELNLKTTG